MTWSLGVLIGGPVALLFILAGLISLAIGLRMWRSGDSYTESDGSILVGLGSATVVLTLLISAWAYYPYSGEYHKWQPKGGTVTAVNSRILGSGKSVTQRFVVQFGDGQEYACDDTRCSLVKVGDRLDLSCKREWQYAGVDGWSCNYMGRQS